MTATPLGWRLAPEVVMATTTQVSEAADRVIDGAERLRRSADVAAGGCGQAVLGALNEFIEVGTGQLEGERTRVARSVAAAVTAVAIYEAADQDMSFAYNPAAFGPGRKQRLHVQGAQ